MEVPILGGPACTRCGDALEYPVASTSGPADRTAGLCRACRLAPPAFERAVAYALYQDPMRSAIHALKYERMHPAARRLGRMLAQAIVKLAPDAPDDLLVVPVPLHRARQSERGFNQARSLASHAIKALRVSHPHWKLALAPAALMRQRATESQASLTPRQRRINVRGAFSVSDAAAVKQRHILLVDDIFTTGATVRAAALVLRRAGAASVWVATLARARRMQSNSAHHFIATTVETQGDTGTHEQVKQVAASVDSSVNHPSS